MFSQKPITMLLLCLIPVIAGINDAFAGTMTGIAEIVSLEGSGDVREADVKNWAPAQVAQELFPGNFVRTASYSRMGLLFRDRTQIRLRERSVLQVKDAAGPGRTTGRNLLRLDQGRAWTQSKGVPGGLTVETPSATAAIRGTDWELAVEQDGSSTITVLSGEVDFYNDLGSVKVGRNEQARAEIGKPPVKVVVVNPQDRVQWVTAYPVDALRHLSLSGSRTAALQSELNALIGDDADIRSKRGALLADLGRWKEAQAEFSAVVQADPDNGPGLLGLAFTHLWYGRTAEAEALIGRAEKVRRKADRELSELARAAAFIQNGKLEAAITVLQRLVRAPELQHPSAYLVLSDLMLYTGERTEASHYAEQAQQRFPRSALPACQLARIDLINDRADDAKERANEALSKDRDSYEALLVLGDSSRLNGDADAAIGYYTQAVLLRPQDDRGWYGLGVVQTEREDVRKGRKTLAQALDLKPDGPGYQGQRGTLETFANRFSAAEQAYGQALKDNSDDFVALTGLGILELKRGNTKEALDAFLRAELLEPQYARVQLYKAVAYYQLGLRVQAQEALRRASELDDKDPMPHLMASVIHTDLYEPGAALDEAREALRLMPYLKSLNQLASDQKGSANLGRAFAYFGMEEWAQSYAQESFYPFWAGSHLFLADRYSGFYTKNSELFQGYLADPTVFGAGNRFQSLIQRPGHYLTAGYRYGQDNKKDVTMPTAGVSGFLTSGFPAAYFVNYEPLDIKSENDDLAYKSLTAAVGIKPTDSLGLFIFGSDGRQTFSTIADGGLLYALDDSLDVQRADVGVHYSFSPSSQIWFKAGRFESTDKLSGTLTAVPIQSTLDVELPEYAARHSFDAGHGHEITWGGESATKENHWRVIEEVLPGASIDSRYQYRERSWDLYLSDRYSLNSNLLLQIDIPYQKHVRKAEYVDYGLIPPFPPILLAVSNEEQSLSGFNPRAGIVYRFDDVRLVRIAYQSWVRPIGLSTLGPVATAGIPLDDRLVASGGKLNRVKGQIEWEWGRRTFTSAFVDHKNIRNQTFFFNPFTLTEIEDLYKLQERSFATLASDDLLEATPDFGKGKVTSAGFGVNQVLTSRWSAFARYAHTRSRNTALLFEGRDIPHLPRHAGAVGTTWVGPRHLFFITRFTYRTDRFIDEANTERLTASWDGSADLFWESPQKYILARVGVDEMFDRNEATFYSAELLIKY